MSFPESNPTESKATEVKRLADLIEFAKESARLRTRPASAVSQHKLFALYEEDFQDRPGILFNQGADELTGDEVWLEVERLHESMPPQCEIPLVIPWLVMTQGPDVEPTLRASTTGEALIAANRRQRKPPNQLHDEGIDPSSIVHLHGYEHADEVRVQLEAYVANVWRPWAEDERKRRWTIRLYGDLFTLKQRLEGSIVESQIELIWGVGLGIWNTTYGSASYPFVTRSVELSLNPLTQSIEVRPRDVDAKLEIDWYASIDNPGVEEVERAAKEFFGKAAVTFSPFDRGSFEPLLKAGATHLDPNGVYWPNEVPPEDRRRPKATENLRVTDTWVLFARPRSNSILIQDLESLKREVEQHEDSSAIPAAIKAFVQEPSQESEGADLPSFRGVSASYSIGEESSRTRHTTTQDLYFPKPFNDEQLRIIQLLERYDGVVVQGPPGTGKTHTIANVICHYLANGKRVLVTSMKDHALGVLREQLPEEIRPLAISLLTSELEGIKQFEHSIEKIASEVQALDRTAYQKEILHLEDSINALHGKLVRIDRNVSEWARKNLESIRVDGKEIDPQDAAREVVEGAQYYQWMPDSLGIGAEFEPRFDDSDIVALRTARRELGEDITYLGKTLPELIEFPEGKRLLSVHQDLSRFAILAAEVERGSVPPLADSGQETLAAVQSLVTEIQRLRKLRDEVASSKRPWCTALRDLIRTGAAQNLLALLDSLGNDLRKANEERKEALTRPVAAPPDAEKDAAVVQAVMNLAAGQSAFGLAGLIGKGDQKRILSQVTLLGQPPQGADAWAEVARHLELQRHLRQLATRWNALANELKIETVADTGPQGGIAAADFYDLYFKVKESVAVERRIVAGARKTFPEWQLVDEVGNHEHALLQLDKALRHHLTKSRLAEAWSVKEAFHALVSKHSGAIVERLRTFLEGVLGNPAVTDAAMQSQWSTLMAELSRTLALRAKLLVVADITRKIVESGAPALADALRQPLATPSDPYLPDNWKQAWRLRRLASHLAAIDAQDVLKSLASDRSGVERDLANAYRQVVVKRTWLRLAENASPSIRSALQAYLHAVQKIGKGTGKRAIRYRQDARNSARQANPAVPCWIMPHYRVSESLPPELGCFDLVVIDEASQSDLSALPALLRGRKLLIVGDDKQVSPEGVGLEEEKIKSLMTRFLKNQVETYRSMMSPERSIYDLCRVVFAQSGFMLKEHFRCVAPIIEFSKREFYNHELRPLRIPKFSERLDPPLVDVLVEDGFRTNDTNSGEANFIVEEFGRLVTDPRMVGRSIGVVSLLGTEQALHIWERLSSEYGPDVLDRHKVACGDARTFQGKERNVMFLSMVHAPNYSGAVLSRDTFAQRFNVAASRAKDRMYLVRSVRPEDLSEKDLLRRNLIQHFSTPFYQDAERISDLRTLCESPFEREVYDVLVGKGYCVTPQVRVGQYRIDMVVEGNNDTRLAVECDGDKYHGPEKWADDMQRQRVLERAGWVFWRCFASNFVRRRQAMVEDLVKALELRGIGPVGADKATRSVHAEQRVYSAFGENPSLKETVPEHRADNSSPADETRRLPSGSVTPFSLTSRLPAQVQLPLGSDNRSDRAHVISKSRFIGGQYCSRRLWLETHMRDLAATSESNAIKWGNRVGALARSLWPEGRLIGHEHRFDLALEETRRSLEGNGDVTLFEPVFSTANMAARCDILQRKSGRYSLVEVKASTSKKEHHPIDVAFQVAALKSAGIPVSQALLAFVDSSFVYQGHGDYKGLFTIEDVSEEVTALQKHVAENLNRFQQVLAGPEPQASRGRHCQNPWECGYQSRCSIGEAEYPIGLLGIRNAAFLEIAANEKWRDIRDIPESALTTANAKRIWKATCSGQPYLGTEAAAVLGSSRPKMQYLDFETWAPAIPRWEGTRPYQQLPFQWSLHTDHGSGELVHAEFLDDTGEFPVRKAAVALIEATQRCDYSIAVYTGFENNVIGTMIEFCPDLEGPLRQIQNRLLDLHPLAKQSYYHPEMRGSWSIKAIIPIVAPSLKYENLVEIHEGGEAVRAYEEIIDPSTGQERKAKLVNNLKAYCQRDTEAMVALVRHLGSASPA